jgi:hypothetical protein
MNGKIELANKDERNFLLSMDLSVDRRKEILNFVYELAKINSNLIEEVLDQNLNSQLKYEIENYDF